jgi:hypothetical protein
VEGFEGERRWVNVNNVLYKKHQKVKEKSKQLGGEPTLHFEAKSRHSACSSVLHKMESSS